jgi:hypothetical protein
MKSLKLFTVAAFATLMLSSCGMLNSLFKPKYGCKTNGKNVGAEKILSGDPEATKAADKAKKFRN